jgi:multicomponent Na+:H+ antiporter subunit B
MSSLILRTAARYLMVLLLLFSVFLLARGHNQPGGGFAGGLVAAAAFVLYGLAYGVAAARAALRAAPHALIGVGLLTALTAGLLPVLAGRPLLTGLWGYLPMPGGKRLDVGTPLLFDAGVYLAVLGVTLTILLALAEEEE